MTFIVLAFIFTLDSRKPQRGEGHIQKLLSGVHFGLTQDTDASVKRCPSVQLQALPATLARGE